MSLTVGGLFSGVGGLELGLEWAGLRTKWQVEVEEYAVSILEKRWPDVRRLGDITKVDWRDVERVDVVCGGFPCQDISTAGKRAGLLAGGRSGLWREFARCLETIRPRYAVIENVAGLLSGADDMLTCAECGAVGRDFLDDGDVLTVVDTDYCNSHEFLEAVAVAELDGFERPEPRSVQRARIGAICVSCGGRVGDTAGEPVRQSWMGRVLGDLAALGYDAEWECLPAAAFGAPHLRYRTFIVAYTDGDNGRGVQRTDDEPRHDPEVPGGRNHPEKRDLPDTDGERGGDEPGDAGDGLGRRVADDAGPVREAVADTVGPGQGLRGGEGAGGGAGREREADHAGARGEPAAPVADADGSGGAWRASGEAEGHGGGRRGPHAEVLSGQGDGQPGVLRRAAIRRWAFWAAEPDVGRVADGIPARVDRLRCLGNAVVPQVAEWIGRCIVDHAMADAASWQPGVEAER